jgi:hypothetical protein
MAAGNNASTVASQLEYVRGELEEPFLTSSILWSRIEARTDIKPVSSRPSRIPTVPLPPAAFRQAGVDGQGLGRGQGAQEVYGTLSCVYFSAAIEYTAQTEYATDSNEKAIKDYVALTTELNTRQMAGFMDALVATSDGSNTLDTVVSAGATSLIVNNPNAFSNQQNIDIYSSLTGAAGFVATVQINTVDTTNSELWLTGPVPAGVTAGYFLVVNGSAGLPNSGLFGLPAYQVGGNAGTWMNLLRSSFPDQFSARNIPANGALTPAIVRALLNQIILAKGEAAAESDDLVIHLNVDMDAAWEDNALLVQRIDIASGRRKESDDMLAKKSSSTMAGYEKIVNPRAIPGRIDFLALKKWGRLEAKPLDLYEVDGQTTFPAYAADGSIATSNMSWLLLGCQVGSWLPRINAYISNVTIPKNYFGH